MCVLQQLLLGRADGREHERLAVGAAVGAHPDGELARVRVGREEDVEAEDGVRGPFGDVRPRGGGGARGGGGGERGGGERGGGGGGPAGDGAEQLAGQHRDAQGDLWMRINGSLTLQTIGG